MGFFAVLLLCCLVGAIEHSSTEFAKESWIFSGRASTTNIYKAKIVLKPLSSKKLRDLFLDVSDPSSPRYTQYPEDNCVFVTRNDVEKLSRFLKSQGVSVVTKNKCQDVWSLSGTGESFFQIFGVVLNRYVHKDEKRFSIVASGTPVRQRDELDIVQLLHGFHFPVLATNPKRKDMKATSFAEAEFATATPAILKALYNITDGPVSDTKASQV